MTKLNCKITDAIQKDFSSLWKCQMRGKTLEISTPYLLPDSTLFSVFLTERNGRYIVCDGGTLSEILSDYCPLPDDEIRASLDGFAKKFEIKVGAGSDKQKIFFKSTVKRTLISSLVFDIATFATSVASALVAVSYDEPNLELEDRFPAKADAFLRAVIPLTNGLKFRPRREIKEVPGVKFSGIIERSNKIWIVSYVSGSNPTYFRKSVAETIVNFEHAWGSSLSNHIAKTIPFLNSEAQGYQPNRLKWQIAKLNETSQNSLLDWKNRDEFSALLAP